MWIACFILVVAVLSATWVGIGAVAFAVRWLALAILPVVAVVTRAVYVWPALSGSLSLVGFIVHPRDTMRVASGRSVTIAVFVPLFLSIIYTVIVIIVIIMSVLRRERAVHDPTHCVRHGTFSLTKEREPEGPVPLCTCKSISRSPDPFETVLRNSWFASARTHPPHCRQEAAVPPRAVRGCPPRLPCRARAPSPSTCISQPGDACSSRRISTPNHKTERREAADAHTMQLVLQKRLRRSAAVTNHLSLACRVVADIPCH